MKRITTNNKGFTLIELLLAMTFFSLILMFVTASFLQVTRAYNKGITVKRVHESGRAVIAEMSRSLAQASSEPGSVQTGTGCLISAGTRYRWNTGFHTTTNPGGHGHAALSNGNDFSLVRDNVLTCGAALNANQVVNMLDDKVIVQNISVTQVGSAINTYSLSVSLSSRRGTSSTCDVINDTYCDTVTLSTVVSVRN